MSEPETGILTTRAPHLKLGGGHEIASHWITVNQSMIDEFGQATLDPDPMHIDPEWAAKNSPFAGTIAFGFLTMSLLTNLLHSALGTSPQPDPASKGLFLNYGFDRMRLVSPVPCGSRIRGVFRLQNERVDDKGRIVVTFESRVEIENAERLALAGTWLCIWLPPS